MPSSYVNSDRPAEITSCRERFRPGAPKSGREFEEITPCTIDGAEGEGRQFSNSKIPWLSFLSYGTFEREVNLSAKPELMLILVKIPNTLTCRPTDSPNISDRQWGPSCQHDYQITRPHKPTLDDSYTHCPKRGNSQLQGTPGQRTPTAPFPHQETQDS